MCKDFKHFAIVQEENGTTTIYIDGVADTVLLPGQTFNIQHWFVDGPSNITITGPDSTE